MQMLYLSHRLAFELEKQDEQKISELIKQSDEMTAEYCAILGYAMDEKGNLDEEKLNTELSQDVLNKQIEKAGQNPVYQWMKADFSADQAMKNMVSVGKLSEEEFVQGTVNAHADHQANRENEQKKLDEHVDEILRDMGFDPAILRKQSAEAASKPLNIPGVQNIGERMPKPVALPQDNPNLNL